MNLFLGYDEDLKRILLKLLSQIVIDLHRLSWSLAVIMSDVVVEKHTNVNGILLQY